MAFIAAANISFSRDLDVTINVSRPQTETLTDFSVPVAIVQNPPFDHGSGRVRIYRTIQAVEADFATTTEAWRMASAFFAQEVRADRMAIGGAFTTAQAAFLLTGTVTATVADFAAVSDGSFSIEIDGDRQDITTVDFTGDADFDDVVATLQAAIRGVGTGGFSAATVTFADNQFRITSGTTGDSSSIDVLQAEGTGTDISGAAFLNGLVDQAVGTNGYTPTGIAGEAANIQQAAANVGVYLYGWAAERAYRNTTDQEALSDWIQARRTIFATTSNDAAALNPDAPTDIGSVLRAKGNFRTLAFWSDTVAQYPEMALLAYILHVNYRAENSTVTAKFKNLAGITPVGINETQLTTLQTKRYNVLTRVGNAARTVRDGVQVDQQWFIDDLVNLDNFHEDLQVEVFNAFLRNGKIPYTPLGVNILTDAIDSSCRRYVFNGTFAARPVLDPTTKTGRRLDPAYRISNTPLELVPTADRAARIGPPFTVDANLAGAIHSLAINVNAFT